MTHRAVAMVIGQTLDGLTFAAFALLIPAATMVGIVEHNPITSSLHATLGVGGVVAIKVGLPMLAFALVLRMRTTRRTVALLALVAAYSGFIGAAFNAYAIGQVLALMGHAL